MTGVNKAKVAYYQNVSSISKSPMNQAKRIIVVIYLLPRRSIKPSSWFEVGESLAVGRGLK